MKDEIKEIIDDFLLDLGTLKYVKDNVSLDCRISKKEGLIILDCITNLQEENKILNLELTGYREAILRDDKLMNLKSRIDKANALLDEMLERAYIDGEYIMYDYSTSELLEVKQALQGEDKDD